VDRLVGPRHLALVRRGLSAIRIVLARASGRWQGDARCLGGLPNLGDRWASAGATTEPEPRQCRPAPPRPSRSTRGQDDVALVEVLAVPRQFRRSRQMALQRFIDSQRPCRRVAGMPLLAGSQQVGSLARTKNEVTPQSSDPAGRTTFRKTHRLSLFFRPPVSNCRTSVPCFVGSP
jgi:hypothetical protein